jgi:hypothetical protein
MWQIWTVRINETHLGLLERHTHRGREKDFENAPKKSSEAAKRVFLPHFLEQMLYVSVSYK